MNNRLNGSVNHKTLYIGISEHKQSSQQSLEYSDCIDCRL